MTPDAVIEWAMLAEAHGWTRQPMFPLTAPDDLCWIMQKGRFQAHVRATDELTGVVVFGTGYGGLHHPNSYRFEDFV